VRLTRRGRAVLTALAIMALVLVVALAGLAGVVRAQATGSGVPSRDVYRHLTAVVVRPGQTLWSIAERSQPGADPRTVVQELIDLNGLQSSAVQAGERLWVPRG
jgi:hypothetical protein